MAHMCSSALPRHLLRHWSPSPSPMSGLHTSVGQNSASTFSGLLLAASSAHFVLDSWLFIKAGAGSTGGGPSLAGRCLSSSSSHVKSLVSSEERTTSRVKSTMLKKLDHLTLRTPRRGRPLLTPKPPNLSHLTSRTYTERSAKDPKLVTFSMLLASSFNSVYTSSIRSHGRRYSTRCGGP